MLSWAAKRKVIRPEDKAYSLLTMHNINMPLLYGERSAKAFYGYSLLSRFDDETIFCWIAPPEAVHTDGLLSTTPKAFARSGSYKPNAWDAARRPLPMTNKGHRFEPLLLPATDPGAFANEFIMPLNCFEQKGVLEQNVGIRIIIPAASNGKSAVRFTRGGSGELFNSSQRRNDTNLVRRTLYFRQDWEHLP